MTTIDVAICVAGDGALLSATLPALAAQHDAPIVALAGSTAERERATALARRLVPHARVVLAEGPGLAHARNAAVAASRAEVVALVEEDVLVGPGWLAALAAAWAGDPEAGAIGGPVRPGLVGARPAWLTDALLGAFGLLDLGAADALDPAAQTLLGANLSVRGEALRGVGGFWPQRGHPATRDWFSDEHHAQRELARSGWAVRYAPEAGAERLIVTERLRPLGVVARRARYGARLAATGGAHARPRTTAARQALSSLAGAAVGGRRLAVERLARSAENAAVVAGASAARRSLAPAGTSPFRAHVPPAAARRPRLPLPRGDRGAVVLLYHRLGPGAAGLCVSPEHFAEHVEVLAARGGSRPLDELVRAPERGALAVTFDDGYADNLQAAQMLAGRGIPASFFVCTAHVAQGRGFFWDELDRLLLGDGPHPERLTLDGPDRRAWGTRTPEERAAARRHLQGWLQSLPAAAVEDLMAQLRGWAGDPGEAPAGARPLTRDELAELAALPGMSVGGHGRDHVALGLQSRDVVAEQVAGCRDDLATWLGRAPGGFAYPYGVPGQDFTPDTAEAVSRAGFGHALANAPGRVTARTDPYAVPRLAVPDVAGEEFRVWLEAVAG